MKSFREQVRKNAYNNHNLIFAAQSGYCDAVNLLLADGAKIASCSAWNQLFEKKGLLGLLRCVPKLTEQHSIAIFASLIGYAVLQNIDASYKENSKLKPDEQRTLNELHEQLDQFETQLKNLANYLAKLEGKINNAISVWQIAGVHGTGKWAPLVTFMRELPFSHNPLTVDALIKQYDRISEGDAASNIAPNEPLFILSNAAKEALNYMPERVSNEDPSNRCDRTF